MRRPTGSVLTLDAGILEADHIIRDWQACLNMDSLRLTGIEFLDETAGDNFKVSGHSRFLQDLDCLLEITFFVSHDPQDPDPFRLECLIQTRDLLPTWKIASLYPDLPGYISYAPGESSLGRQDSFLKQIDFSNPKFVYSSYDFVDAEHLNLVQPSDPLTTSLDQPPRLDGRMMKAGVSFTSDIALPPKFAEQIKQVNLDLNQIHILGNIYQQEDGPFLELAHDLLDSHTGNYPSIRLGANGEIFVSLKQLAIRSGLAAHSEICPGFFFLAQIGADDFVFDVMVDLPAGAADASISASFETGHPLTLGQLEKALGIERLAGHFPKALTSFGQLALESIELDVSLSPLNLRELRFVIGTANPWKLLPKLISVQPSFGFQFDFLSRPVEISFDWTGQWRLGETLFEMSISSNGDVNAEMAVGEKLDVAALFEKFLPGIDTPEFELIDLDLAGNYEEGSYFFQATAGSDWSINLGGTPVSITDLAITAEYSGSAFSGSIIGRIKVGGWALRVDVELKKLLTIQITIPELDVSDLLEDFLHEISLPAELPDFVLSDFDVKIVPSTGSFDIRGKSTTPVKVFPGFNFTVDYFQVARDARQNKTAQLDLSLLLGDFPVKASALYDAAAKKKA